MNVLKMCMTFYVESTVSKFFRKRLDVWKRLLFDLLIERKRVRWELIGNSNVSGVTYFR